MDSPRDGKPGSASPPVRALPTREPRDDRPHRTIARCRGGVGAQRRRSRAAYALRRPPTPSRSCGVGITHRESRWHGRSRALSTPTIWCRSLRSDLSGDPEGRRPTGSFRAYLFTSIRNTAAGWGRARREAPIDELDTVADPSSTEQATNDALDRSLSAQAFRSLPSRWQEVLWYSEIEQMNPAEIAPLLGMTPPVRRRSSPSEPARVFVRRGSRPI